MNLDAQTIAVLTIIVAATVYLARVAWQTVARRKAAACAGCSNCPAGEEEPQVVGIGRVSRKPSGAANTSDRAGRD